jgi:antitoxin component HigA of HigAB toxin-antitoxin module
VDIYERWAMRFQADCEQKTQHRIELLRAKAEELRERLAATQDATALEQLVKLAEHDVSILDQQVSNLKDSVVEKESANIRETLAECGRILEENLAEQSRQKLELARAFIGDETLFDMSPQQLKKRLAKEKRCATFRQQVAHMFTEAHNHTNEYQDQLDRATVLRKEIDEHEESTAQLRDRIGRKHQVSATVWGSLEDLGLEHITRLRQELSAKISDAQYERGWAVDEDALAQFRSTNGK